MLPKNVSLNLRYELSYNAFEERFFEFTH